MTTITASLFVRKFEKIVLLAYQWLSENYRPGDRIFLFGKKSTYSQAHMSLLSLDIQVFLVAHTKFDVFRP